MRDRIEDYQLVEGVDYGVFAKFGENSQGGRPSQEYHITLTAAHWLAAESGNEGAG